MTFQALQSYTSDLHDRIVGSKSRCELLYSQIEEKVKKKTEYRESQEIYREASILIGRAADDAREGIRQRFETTVSSALQAVFDPSYEFHIQVTQHANATSADFYISSEENREPQDPLTARGGSVVDVCAVALRLAYLEEMGVPGPVFFDECTKHVSEGFRDAAAEMLVTLQRITGRQLVIVTHDRTLMKYADKVIEL